MPAGSASVRTSLDYYRFKDPNFMNPTIAVTSDNPNLSRIFEKMYGSNKKINAIGIEIE